MREFYADYYGDRFSVYRTRAEVEGLASTMRELGVGPRFRLRVKMKPGYFAEWEDSKDWRKPPHIVAISEASALRKSYGQAVDCIRRYLDA